MDYASILTKVKSKLQERADKVVELEEEGHDVPNGKKSDIPQRLYRNHLNKKLRNFNPKSIVIDPMPYEGRKIKKKTSRMLTYAQKTKIVHLAIVKCYKHE